MKCYISTDDISIIIITLTSCLVSFSIFGLPFYPYLDSDIAVQVYQSSKFRLPEDLYFWNQDRLGSIVPLFGFLLQSIFKSLPPIWSVSISKYIFVFLTCFIGSKLLIRKGSKLLFIFFICFPTYEMRFLLLVGHPYIEQLFFVLTTLFLTEKIFAEQRPKLLPVLGLMQCFAVWISDFSALIIICFVFIPLYKTYTDNSVKLSDILARVLFPFWKQIALYFTLVVLFLVSILSLKNTIGGDPTYFGTLMVDKDELITVLNTLWLYFSNVLTNSSISTWNTIMFYGYVVVVVWSLRLMVTKRLSRLEITLGITTVICFLVTSTLHWVAINYVMIKYYIPTITIFFLFLLLILEKSSRRYYPIAWFLIALIVFSNYQVLQTGLSWKFDDVHYYSDLKEVSTMPKPIYIAGQYWNSYVYGIASPETVICTPVDFLDARNKEFYSRVQSQDSIYVTEQLYNSLGRTESIYLFNGTEYFKASSEEYKAAGTIFHKFGKT